MESIIKKIREKRHRLVKKNQRNNYILDKVKGIIAKVVGKNVNLDIDIRDNRVTIRTNNKTVSNYIFIKKEKIKELLYNHKISLDLIIK